MNYLVGDIGNTNIKICKIDKKFRIKNTYLFNSKSSNLKKELASKIKNISKKNFNKNVLFSSVVPQVFNKIKFVFKKKKMRVYEIKNFNLKKLMKFNIKKYSQLGSDRIANSVGAYSKFKTNCIIIDFGTATTFDVIKNNEYFGGLIFPGINLSMSSLIKSAELLKPSKISKSKKVVNRNTSASIQSGFYFGYLHAINGIIKQIKKENNFKPKIFITGGLSSIFRDKILFRPIYKENLTLEGIREIGKKYL